MANPEHTAWLLEGVESWNERRQKVPGKGYLFTPDFEGAPLYWIFRDANKLDGRGRIPLAGADLVDADLTKADLNSADLSGANLELATLAESKLWRADLTNANLHFADLTGATLTASEPWKADLYPRVIRSPRQYPDESELITTIKDLLTMIQSIRDYYDEAYDEPLSLYFRGESECEWDLRPSVMRSDLAAYERNLLNDLVSRRPEEFNGMTSALAQWVLAQHHGLPTRFLDVTRNPLVALFHACDITGQKEQKNEDGRLHVFVVPRALVKTFDSDAISIVSNAARLSRFQRDALLGKHFSMGDNRIRREIEHPEAMCILYQLIRQEKPYFEERIDPRDFYQVFVVEPQQSSERLRAQAGAFLVSAFHEQFERDEILKWNEEIPVYAHYKLRISWEHKNHILEDLQLLDVTRENLFPGLDSSAESVTNSYHSVLRRMVDEREQRRLRHHATNPELKD